MEFEVPEGGGVLLKIPGGEGSSLRAGGGGLLRDWEGVWRECWGGSILFFGAETPTKLGFS